MQSYSLIEYKLRRYFYLGHEYSMYVPPAISKSVNKTFHYDDITGVRIIGKIVKKDKAKEINSIVPIIIKIKKEDTLHDDRLLIFTLAVCARFNLKQCSKMMADAYAAISEICTDGLKLLMFVKFCWDVNKILHNEGYLPTLTSGFGSGFRKAINKWYLSKDPLIVTELIVKSRSYDGWTHKHVMNLMHTKSSDPSRQVFMTYAKKGMGIVEKSFGSKFNNLQSKNENESLENIEFKFVYKYLKQVNDLKKMDVKTLRNEIELNRWGHDYEVVPKNMLKYYTILISLVTHMPLRTLLNNTFFLAKHKLFANASPDIGLWEFILRFNNTLQLEKHRIHPIESYIEYVKYARSFNKLLAIQNAIYKKQGHDKVESVKDKLILCFEMKSFSDDEINCQITDITDITTDTFENEICATQSTVENVSTSSQVNPSNSKINYQQQNQNNEQSNPTVSSPKKQKTAVSENDKFGNNLSKNCQNEIQTQKLTEPVIISEENNKGQTEMDDTSNQLSALSINVQQNNPESKLEAEFLVQSETNVNSPSQQNYMYLMKQPPKLVDKILQFLSSDLLEKTLKIIKPTYRRIMIVYDNRTFMKDCTCACTRLLTLSEAVTLITLSLIKPEKLHNKPTVCCFNESLEKSKIKIEHNDALTFTKLHSIMFGEPPNVSDPYTKKLPNVDSQNFLSVMNWARENKEEYDVFLFLGTNKMDFKALKESKTEYKTFVKKPVKIITCCLNGQHSEQFNLCRSNMLFIHGFDKNVGKIIRSFINGEF